MTPRTKNLLSALAGVILGAAGMALNIPPAVVQALHATVAAVLGDAPAPAAE